MVDPGASACRWSVVDMVGRRPPISRDRHDAVREVTLAGRAVDPQPVDESLDADLGQVPVGQELVRDADAADRDADPRSGARRTGAGQRRRRG
jgi:hypothetical protein